MKNAVITGAVMLMAVSTAAFGQTPSSAQDVPGYPGVKVLPVDAAKAAPASGTTADGASLQQQLSASLAKAGYTNVKIVPEAFIVEAKNKSGDPVTMFLSPDSMTVFTAADAKGKDTRTAPGEQAAAPKTQ